MEQENFPYIKLVVLSTSEQTIQKATFISKGSCLGGFLSYLFIIMDICFIIIFSLVMKSGY